MSIPAEVRSLLQHIAKREAEGERAPNCVGLFSLDSINDAESLGLVSLSIGSWQDDGLYCGLKNKGREALGLPREITPWDRLLTMVDGLLGRLFARQH